MCMYQVNKVREVIYVCDRGIEFSLFNDFSIVFWKFSDSVAFFVFQLLYFLFQLYHDIIIERLNNQSIHMLKQLWKHKGKTPSQTLR